MPVCICSIQTNANELDSNTDFIFITHEDLLGSNFINVIIDNSILQDDGTYRITTAIKYTCLDGTTVNIDASYVILINQVFTPNGTDVHMNGIGGVYNITADIPNIVIDDVIVRNRINYGIDPIDDLSIPTYDFNCHSYAWYNAYPINSVWIENPISYYSETDCSYRVINTEIEELREGDIVCYYTNGANCHSGIITGFTDEEFDDSVLGLNTITVKSKWGYEPIYEHRGDNCPYATQSDEIVYYRLNTHSSHNISSTTTDYEIEPTLNSYSSNILDTYAMYELNIEDDGIYDIFISSSNQVTGYILDIDRNNVANISLNNNRCELKKGIYYLRVAFTEENIGDINISISSHTHSYSTYTPINQTCSALTCSCGKQSTITHSYTYGYEMIDNTYHVATCACGFKSSTHTRHTVDADYIDPIDSDKYAKCKFCKGRFIKSTGNFPIIKNKYFENIIDIE